MRALALRRGSFAARQWGASLIEMAAVLMVLTGLVVALVYKTSDFFSRAQALDTQALLDLADSQLRQFIAANGRLPCPDLDGDGFADADADGSCNGQQKGYLPYRTLGMTDPAYTYGEVPMLYGAYRSGATSFTSRSQTYFPTYRDADNEPVELVTSRSTFDFCATLAQLKALPQPTYPGSGALGMTDGTQALPAVFALAVAGRSNRDRLPGGWVGGPSINAQYDGHNATSANWFELPQTGPGARYDDRTHYRGPQDLHDYLRCESMNGSITLLAEAISVEKEAQDLATGNAETVEVGLHLNKVGIALASWQLLQTFAAIAEASEDIGVSAGLLAGASAACAIPPWVACALIPVYATALASGNTGMGFAIGAAAAAAVGLGLQIAATVLYDDAADRTATAPAEPVASISNIPDDRLIELLATYVGSKSTAVTAYGLVPSIVAPTDADLTAYQSARDSRLATVNAGIDTIAAASPSLADALGRNLNGRTATCTPPAESNCAGYAARTVVVMSGGQIVYQADGVTPQTQTIYTRDLVASPYSPGVAPAREAYYGALAQAGANTPLAVNTGQLGAEAAAAVNSANATLSSMPVVDPSVALAASNAVTNAYSALLAATADFDQKNLAYAAAAADYAALATPASQAARDAAAAARDISLATLRSALGDPSWDYTGSASLCGAGATSACGWMVDAVPAAGSGSTAATSSASRVNDYLAASATYQDALAYRRLKDAADAAANTAWSHRNSLKTALCAVQVPSVQFVGTTSRSSDNPSDWDQTENLTATGGGGVPAPVNLSCVGGGTAPDATASAAQRYCAPESPSYDAALCAQLTAPAGAGGTRSSIRGTEAIVNTLIEKGIAR